MRAVQLTKYGGKGALQFTAEATKPTIEAGQVLVKVQAASVNVLDWKIREGMAQAMAPLNFPATLGSDLAGTITEMGEGVSGFVIGQEVYGQTNPLGGTGSFAEFTPIAAGALATKPQSLTFIEAAATPLTAVSAYQALVEVLDIQDGQKILIHGGAGGIGSFAIQLAKHLGAYVITTAASNDIAYVRGLGADEVIDYTSQKFEELLHDLDAVYDTVGGETYTRSFAVMKPGGKIISMTERPNESLAQEHGIKAEHLFTQVTTERLKKIAKLIDQGILHVHVDRVFPLEKAADAVEYLHEGRHHGKVVLDIAN
jgi:alcohol dehydrogenase